MNDMNREEWLEVAGVPRVYRWCDVDAHLLPTSLVAWAEKIPGALGEGGSALLVGPPGSGKTVAAVWFLSQVYSRWWKTSGRSAGSTARFMRGGDLVRALFERDWKVLRTVRRVRVLLLDDQGVAHDRTGWGASAFEELIEERWSEGRSTLVTTNLLADSAGDSFKRRYGRAYSRLCDARGPGVIEINRRDLRQKENGP